MKDVGTSLQGVPQNGTVTHAQMIISFRDNWLETFFVDDAPARTIPADIQTRLFRKLQLIDDALSDNDLRAPPSNHFEKLKGSLSDFHSIRVNRKYRLVFRWDGRTGEAHDVYLDDHSYR